MDANSASAIAGIDTASADSIPRDISHATNACVRSLQECRSVPELMDGSWAENRLADFNLWAAGVGASARSRASLDWRLHFQPEVHIVLTSLLVTLKNFTDECKDIGKCCLVGRVLTANNSNCTNPLNRVILVRGVLCLTTI